MARSEMAWSEMANSGLSAAEDGEQVLGKVPRLDRELGLHLGGLLRVLDRAARSAALIDPIAAPEVVVELLHLPPILVQVGHRLRRDKAPMRRVLEGSDALQRRPLQTERRARLGDTPGLIEEPEQRIRAIGQIDRVNVLDQMRRVELVNARISPGPAFSAP